MDAPRSDLLRQSIIKTESQLIVLYDSIWQDSPYTGRSIGSYIEFYQAGTIYHCTHVPGPFYQSSADSEYNAESTEGMSIVNFRILNNELLNKDPDVVLET